MQDFEGKAKVELLRWVVTFFLKEEIKIPRLEKDSVFSAKLTFHPFLKSCICLCGLPIG